jgi:hypothetical protein
MPGRHSDHMIKMRRGVILGLVLGSLVGGTAGATILTAVEHRENARHAQVQPASSAAAPGATAAASPIHVSPSSAT